MRATAEQVAAVVGGTVVGDGSAVLTGAEVDSRRLEAGDLFVALTGAHKDGHEFVEQALDEASAALVCSDFELANLPTDRALIQTRDPLSSYHALASYERDSKSWTIVALTGSVGKTTTKDFLAHLLAGRFTTGASQGNRNSTLGLPAQLLRQTEDIEVFVAEAGMSLPGELHQLGAILKPNILLYTRIAAAHTEFFADIEAVARAKAELLGYLQPSGTLVINADDPHQESFHVPHVTTVRYGSPTSALRLEKIRNRGLLGSVFDLVIEDDREEVTLSVPGLHQAENYLSAAAAAWVLGVPAVELAERGRGLQAAPRRGQVHRTRDDVTVVDDSYNSSPLAVKRLLELLAATPGRRVAVLGDMYELGDRSRSAHCQVGQQAAEVCDVLVAVGTGDAASLATAAIEAGMPTTAVVHTQDAHSAALELQDRLLPNDIVLVKGSRGVGLDRTVDALLEGEVS
ncbi:MAG: UDP-N-acetylmuramoyl-tripeptide--D-alanyl-D-alanine ligase [bacterium]|nr:UDP-N-acetylmuramoyl-tripeptide--D-alanyl-D-alanine ligase [bacterium]